MAYIANADVLLEENNLEKAMIEYKNALQINQNSPDAWYGVARIHERKQEWARAFNALSNIRDTHPEHLNGHLMLAQIRLAANQIDQALEYADHVMELAPQDARVHSLMATVQHRMGNLEAAHESVEQALILDPDSNEATVVKARLLITEQKYDEAITTLNTALKTQADNTSLYLLKIQAYTELGEDSAIHDVYKALVQQFPENFVFKHALARNHIQMGDIDQAERTFEQMVKDNPEQIEAKKLLVNFKVKYRSIDDAIDLTRNYIEQDQEEYQLRFILAELYLGHRRVDEAMDVYHGIITDDGVQPNGLKARNELALVHLRAGRPDEAKALVEEVLANEKANANALLLQAGFKIAGRHYDDAIVNLRTVLRVYPNSTKALGMMGQIYAAQNLAELATEAYGKAFALSPETSEIANPYATVLMRTGNPEQADKVLLLSLKRGNKSIQAIKLLTEVKLMLGEWDLAEKLAQQLKNIAGEEAASEQVLGLVYQGREQSTESIDAFKRAHELAPDADQPVAALVQTLVRNNKIKEARQFLLKIVSENENNITATLLLAQLSLLEKDIATAVAYFNRAIQINPKHEDSYREMATIYILQGKLDVAEGILMNGLTQNPGSTAIAVNLASIFELQRKYEKAINIYEELLQTNPDLIVAKNNLASLLTDHRQDLESFDRARRLTAEFRNSEVPQFRDTYAWASVRARTNFDQAVAILKGIVEENENVGVYRYHLGEALLIKGDIDNAKIHLNKAIELESEGSPIATQARKSLQLVSE